MCVLCVSLITVSPFPRVSLHAKSPRDILDINDSGSLSELDLSKNGLMSEGLSVVSEALKSTSIKQLNIADNNLTIDQNYGTDMSGVIKFAEDMKDMGLSKITFSGDDCKSKPVSVEVGMTEADFSGAMLQQSGEMILAAWLEHNVQHTTQTDHC